MTPAQPAIESPTSRASSSAATRWEPNALVGVLQELSAATELETVQALVVAAARALADADGATFVLREGDACHYAEEAAISPLWKGRRFPASACISGWAMVHRTVAVVGDIELDPRIPMEVYRPTFVRSLAMLPIRAIDPVGALGVYWSRPHTPGAAQIAALQAIADAAAVGLERVRTAGAIAGYVQELEEANRALTTANASLSHFAAVASHDLRSPLATISGLLSTAVARAEEASSGTDRLLLERAQGQAARLTETVDALLALAEVDATARPTQTVHLDTVAAEVIDQLASEIADRGARVEVASLPSVRGDHRLLRLLLQNLVRNALRFHHPGRTPVVEVEATVHHDHVELRVTDNGRGLPPGASTEIFELFARDPSVQGVMGHGIGLATCRRIAAYHGGTITAEPRELGARFVVELPIGTGDLRRG